jgi:hypothetical protein
VTLEDSETSKVITGESINGETASFNNSSRSSTNLLTISAHKGVINNNMTVSDY